jgi:hypothetical protein
MKEVDMKTTVFTAAIIVTLFAGQSKADSYADLQCFDACSSMGMTFPVCNQRCGTGPTSYLSDLQKAEVTKQQRLEQEQQKLQIKKSEFDCIASCKAAGGNSDQYCETSCLAD